MKISVVGGGYVGLVSSVCFAELGHDVRLIEIDRKKVESINAGEPPIYEKGLRDLLARHAGRRLRATWDYNAVRGSEVSFICVGTPPDSSGAADLSMVVEAGRSLGSSLRGSGDYHVVAVKSTVPPGTTVGHVAPAVMEASGRKPGEIGFAMNPEFLREGIAVDDFMNPDRIVIGSSDGSAGDVVEAVYTGLEAPVVRTKIAAAEMIKYTSNAFLATKISFSNEVGNICKKLGLDVYEVMRGVGMDRRISPHFLNAGAGFGGSCFPKDVSALIHLAGEVGEEAALLRAVMEINDSQPIRMVDLLEGRVGDLRGRRIAVLGLAFKNDTDDIRDSRSIPVISELKRRGADVVAYDPMAEPSMRGLMPDITYCDSAASALEGADGCLVMTEWPEFSTLEKEFDLMKNRIIIEGRRILSCDGKEGICW